MQPKLCSEGNFYLMHILGKKKDWKFSGSQEIYLKSLEKQQQVKPKGRRK